MDTSPERLGLTALQAVRPPRAVHKLATVLSVLFLILPPTLLTAPWQQNVQAKGRVTALDPLDRTQVIPAPVTGRLVEVNVREGVHVEQGEVLARMSDQDPQYALRLEQQMEFTRDKVDAAKDMVDFYDQQRHFLEAAREQAISSARFAYNVAVENVRVTQRELEGLQAELDQKRTDRERKDTLWERGVVSELDFQRAEAAFLAAQAKVEAAKAKVEQARNTELAKEADMKKIASDQQAKVESIKSAREEARSKAALAEKELTEAATRLERQKTQVITAPRSGTVLRVYAASTADFLVQGSPLIELIPATEELAVELWVRGIDAPLISPGAQGAPAVRGLARRAVRRLALGRRRDLRRRRPVRGRAGQPGRPVPGARPARPGRRAVAGPALPAPGSARQRMAAPRHGQPGLRAVAEPQRLPAVGAQRARGAGAHERARARGEGHYRQGQGMSARSFLWLGAMLLTGCQIVPPAPLKPLRPVPRDVLARFELADSETPPTLEPIHVLGESVGASVEGLASAIRSQRLQLGEADRRRWREN